MRVHKNEVIEAIKRDRKNGLSILELVAKFNVPKTTIWHHIHNIELSDAQIKKLRSNQGGNVIRYQKRMEEARSNARMMIEPILNLKQISPIIVSLLYWAEGNKKGGFIFTNTDEKMMRLFLRILRTRFGVESKDIIVMVRIARHASARKAALYWKNVTEVPLRNIRTDVSRWNNSNTKYGICRIRVKKGGYLLKLVRCLNEELTSAIISSTM